MFTLETNIHFGRREPHEVIVRKSGRQVLRLRRKSPELLNSVLVTKYFPLLGIDPSLLEK